MTTTAFDVAVLDMAGTTVLDDGLVEEAFGDAVTAVGVGPQDDRRASMLDHVRTTMGQSKIEVFRHLFGDEVMAERANAAFEDAYAARVRDGRCAAVPGAQEVLRRLRGAGIAVALTTGFSAATQALILDALRWHELIDLTLSPADAGRGRPFPDLPLTALMRLGGRSVRSMAVAGDTASDMQTGVAAGAGVVLGVLTGAHDASALHAAGATHVRDSVRDLPELLGLS